MCGEFSTSLRATSAGCGSSPHVWGIQYEPSLHPRCARFIPTCVGNSPYLSAINLRAAVHPHMCGEFSMPSPACACIAGSSPHVWGILSFVSILITFRRFIPTCVGNSATPSTITIRQSVHPHMCGEFTGHGFPRYQVSGSSPHVWGIPKWLTFWHRHRRFIPTCVGNSDADITDE